MTLRRLAGAALLVGGLLAVSSTSAHAVTLEAVLRASARHHPELIAARKKVQARLGKLLASRGAFDPKLALDAGAAPVGPYGAWLAGVGVAQQTRRGGVAWKGGYRVGADHPVYTGKQVTSDAGEVYVQVGVPLWRGRAIDPARASLRRAELQAEAEAERLRAKALALLEKAGLAWIKWRVAAAKQQVEAELYALAERRARQLNVRAQRGLVAELVAVDNARLLASRRERLLAARQASVAAALKLSLYFRDAAGLPSTPTATADGVGPPPELEAPTELAPEASAQEIAAATEARPEPRVAKLAVAAAGIDIALADNDRAPQLDLLLDASYGLGESQPYGAAELAKSGPKAAARLSLAWPWPQRKARGSAAAARADADAARAMGQLWRERIAVELRTAHTALAAARERMREARRAAEAAHALEQAEWRRFDLGQVDLVVVNLREVATADAAAKAATAWGDLQAARLRLMAANGRLLAWLGVEAPAQRAAMPKK
ncbi:MAG: hypothetical protein RIT45_1728 [Pseudomonadota bacterium]|jgi:outer membrane protein TolC